MLFYLEGGTDARLRFPSKGLPLQLSVATSALVFTTTP
jgi:hypothetical protein